MVAIRKEFELGKQERRKISDNLPVPVLADTEHRDGVCRVGAENVEARESTALGPQKSGTPTLRHSCGGQKLSGEQEKRLRAAMEFAEERERIRTADLALVAAAELKEPDTRYKFKTLLRAIDNRRSGVDEGDIPLWHYQFVKGVEENWPKFWARRGMRPPPISHAVVTQVDQDEPIFEQTRTVGQSLLVG